MFDKSIMTAILAVFNPDEELQRANSFKSFNCIVEADLRSARTEKKREKKHRRDRDVRLSCPCLLIITHRSLIGLDMWTASPHG